MSSRPIEYALIAALTAWMCGADMRAIGIGMLIAVHNVVSVVADLVSDVSGMLPAVDPHSR